MSAEIRIGLIGDYNASVLAHQAIPLALQLIAEEMARPVTAEWIPTEEIQEVARVSEFDALWCVPASPYRDMEGALRAMSWAGPMPNTPRRRRTPSAL